MKKVFRAYLPLIDLATILATEEDVWEKERRICAGMVLVISRDYQSYGGLRLLGSLPQIAHTILCGKSFGGVKFWKTFASDSFLVNITVEAIDIGDGRLELEFFDSLNLNEPPTEWV